MAIAAQKHHFPYSKNMAENMVLGQLLTSHVTDRRILGAMREIPREAFLPEHLRGVAYVDEDIEVSPGRCLMAPVTFARLLDMAKITPFCRVLTIGCLTGYTAAVIGRLSSHVVATDTNPEALEAARAHLARLKIGNVNVQQVTTLSAGYGPSAPYDAIVICGAVHFIPESLASQLAVHGRLVAVRSVATRPGARAGLGKGLLIQRFDHKLQYREHFDAAATLLPSFESAADAFVF